MARHKTNYTISPWLTARTDCKERRFIQVGDTLLLSKDFQSLSVGARLLYMSMAMEAAGKFDFEFPLSVAINHGFHESSFRRYTKELINADFITANSGMATREPNRYRFTEKWKLNNKAKQ